MTWRIQKGTKRRKEKKKTGKSVVKEDNRETELKRVKAIRWLDSGSPPFILTAMQNIEFRDDDG